jgi:hypothetical protein
LDDFVITAVIPCFVPVLSARKSVVPDLTPPVRERIPGLDHALKSGTKIDHALIAPGIGRNHETVHYRRALITSWMMPPRIAITAFGNSRVFS